MKLATFNANSVRSRLEIILSWLKEHGPDVLCIQETKAQDQDFPATAFREAGWHVAFSGEKAYNGVAVMSRSEPDDVVFGFDDDGPADEARLARVRIGGLTIVNTYVPQGRELEHEMYAYKLEWFRRLRAYFDRHCKPDEHVAWMGDLNVAREPIDVHTPEEYEDHVCYHVDARKALSSCCEWGFVDVFRKHHPEPGHYTFFDYRRRGALSKGRGWRLDYIFTSPPLADLSTDSYIDLEPRRAPKPSDHTFLVAEFRGT